MAVMECSIEPLLPTEEGEESLYIHISIVESDGTCRQATIALPISKSEDSDIANAMIECLYGAASMRSPGLVMEMEKRRI